MSPMVLVLLFALIGSLHWKHSELLFDKKGVIKALQQLVISCHMLDEMFTPALCF